MCNKDHFVEVSHSTRDKKQKFKESSCTSGGFLQGKASMIMNCTLGPLEFMHLQWENDQNMKRTWCGNLLFSSQGQLQLQCRCVQDSDFQVSSGYIVRLGNLSSKKIANSEIIKKRMWPCYGRQNRESCENGTRLKEKLVRPSP